MNHDPIPIANADWALEAFGDAERQIALHILQGETPTLRLTYIARRRVIRGDALPDGSLGYDVTPFDLPTERVYVRTDRLTRRERRQRARRGHRGRRGSVRIAAEYDVWARKPYAPEVWLDHVSGLIRCDSNRFPSDPRLDIRIYERQPIGVGIRICERCRCEIRLIVTLYIEHEAPQLTQYISRGLQLAARRFGVDAMHQGQCLCKY